MIRLTNQSQGTRLKILPPQIARLEDEVTQLEALYQTAQRPETKQSHLAKARRRLRSARTKLKKVPAQLQKAEQAAAAHRQRLQQLQSQRDHLLNHLAQLQADNQHNIDTAQQLGIKGLQVKGFEALLAGLKTMGVDH